MYLYSNEIWGKVLNKSKSFQTKIYLFISDIYIYIYIYIYLFTTIYIITGAAHEM